MNKSSRILAENWLKIRTKNVLESDVREEEEEG